MDNERTIILENVSNQSIGLGDTQNRLYRLAPTAKMRISKSTLQDILDFPGSRVILKEGLAKIGNISEQELYNMGLSEEEIENILIKEPVKAVVITEDLKKEDKEIITVKEVKAEEKKEEIKPTTKKTSTKKNSSSKNK
jgi:hypothetical protein